jgi:hypothetical protein
MKPGRFTRCFNPVAFYPITERIEIVSGEGLPRNWMILLGHRMLQYIGEELLGVAGG